MGRGHKTCIRPLGRTQSSPLPLGHPLLANECILHYPGQTLPTGLPPGLSGPPIAHLPSHYPEDTPTATDLTQPGSAHYPRQDNISQQQRDHVIRGAGSEEGHYGRSGHVIRPLSRALSSPVVHLGSPGSAVALRRRPSGCHTVTTGKIICHIRKFSQVG